MSMQADVSKMRDENLKTATEEALEASIQKWQKNLEKAKCGVVHWDAAKYKVDVTGSTCALCKKFYHLTCVGCPVNKRTGQAYCLGTPYVNVVRALYTWEPDQAYLDQLICSISSEIDFLESLREVKEQ